MKQYICTDAIHAQPMSKQEFDEFLADSHMPNEQEESDGYLATYQNGHAFWCPKSVFEKVHCCTDK